METFTQQTKEPLAYLTEIQQRLSFTLSCMELEMQKLGVLSEEVRKVAENLKESSLQTPPPSRNSGIELVLRLKEVGLGDWTVEELLSEAPTLLSTLYSKEQGQ